MPLNFISKKLVLPVGILFFWVQVFQCFGITVKEEEELGQEFMRSVRNQLELVDDPGVNAYVNAVGQKIVKQIGAQPFDYHFYVIKEDTFNAFAGPGAHICVNSGLMEKMESESELAGILGHEIAHVTCRHISEKIQRSSKSSLVSIAGMVVGVFLGIGGLAEASQAVILGTLSGVQSADLAYSRDDEMQADFYGLEYLDKASYDARGLLAALKRIKAADFLGAEYPVYLSTHPAVDERIVFISSHINKQPDIQDITYPLSFKQAQTRLIVADKARDKALNTYKTEVSQNPEDLYANYGYGLALLKAGRYDQSIVFLEKAMAKSPKDPFLKSDIGKAYFMNSQYEKALSQFEAADRAYNDPEARLYIGKCQMELGNFDKAEATFKTLAAPPAPKPEDFGFPDKSADKDKPSKKPDPMEEFLKPAIESQTQLKAIYSLAEVYHRDNKMGDSHYYLGSYYQKLGRIDIAKFHFTKAMEFNLGDEKMQEISKML